MPPWTWQWLFLLPRPLSVPTSHADSSTHTIYYRSDFECYVVRCLNTLTPGCLAQVIFPPAVARKRSRQKARLNILSYPILSYTKLYYTILYSLSLCYLVFPILYHRIPKGCPKARLRVRVRAWTHARVVVLIHIHGLSALLVALLVRKPLSFRIWSK